jgi:hypothetical protein
MARNGRNTLRALAAPAVAMALSAGVARAAEPQPPAAVVERFEVVESRPAFGGARFGDVGDYQLIRGKAHVRVSPEHPANRGIVDLDHAPKTPEGEVRYTADVVILRPRDAAQARRVMIAEVPNRGMRLALESANGVDPMHDMAALMQGEPLPAPFATPAAAGGGFLYRRGYTLVWVGWQADLPDAAALLRAELPAATENGRPITGRVEATTVFDTAEPRSAMALPYPAAPGAEDDAVLSVRAKPDAPVRILPRASWRLEGRRKVIVERAAEMDAGALYQFVYTATDPIVAGLGFAATRDVLAFLRRGEPDASGAANPLADLRGAPCALADPAACTHARGDAVDLVIGVGGSQSGRYLRDLLWQGFNDDGAGRRVFDGLLVQVAGSRKTFTNRRWGEPGRFSRQHEDPLVYGNQFPFTYAVTTDPVTGRRDGLFATCERLDTCPKVFHIDGSSEFWNAGASLVFNDGAGHDLPPPANVRAYMIAGAPHAARMVNASSLLAPNPLNAAGVNRALIVAMDQWLSAGVEPPPSRWPSLARGELAPPAQQSAVGFPDYAGLPYSGVANPVVVTDYDVTPPRSDPARAWQVLVPTVDADGNDRPGIHLPQLAAPAGTYLPWNPRKAGYAQGDLSFLFGGYAPFAATAEARAAAHDPRLSIAERYGDEAGRRRKEDAARRQLVSERLYLDADR